MDDRERLFLAIDLSPEVRDGLLVALSSAPATPSLPRLIPAASWHITLRFLGATPRERRDSLLEKLHLAPLPAEHSIDIVGWGAFPRAAAGRVFWAGVDDDSGNLGGLAALAEAAARDSGFAPEARPFRPHVTLARLRKPNDLRPLLLKLPPVRLRMPVREITLFRSQLGDGPAHYERLDLIRLPQVTG